MSDAISATAAPSSVAPKLDPETLVIRSTPARAIRFKRGVIVALATAAVVAIVIVAWLALKPHIFHIVADQSAMSEPESRPAVDALSILPKSYSDVPQLGPPLPGDLGKPILEHQQGSAFDNQVEGQNLNQAREAERQRQLAELTAASQSGVLVQSSGRTEAATSSAVGSITSPPGETADPTELALGSAPDANGQLRKSEFVAASGKGGDINSHLLAPAASPFILSAGSVIAASLITGLRSDLPGLVTAQVTENVFDSATGSTLLVPQGARLIGSYDSVVAFGQKRALVVWQRIVMPDGSSLRIDNVPATDPSGYAGLADKVDFHTWSLLKGVVLSTLLGVGSELQFSGQGGLIEAIRQSTQQNVAHAGDQLASKTLDVQPTITVRPGAPVRLVVQRDLILAPWRS